MPFVAVMLLFIFMIGASVIIDWGAEAGKAAKEKFRRK